MLFRFLFIILLLSNVAFAQFFEEPWGKGSELNHLQKEPTPSPSQSVGAKLAKGVIRFYQRTISPANGPRSNFRPTSSKYMELAIHRYGFFRGFIMGCDRLLRENSDPWVYRTIEIDGVHYKFDPARTEKKWIP